MTTTYTVTDTATLNTAIQNVDTATSGDYVIKFANDITLTAQMWALNVKSGVTLTISGDDGNGGNYDLNGANAHRGFFAYSGTVTIAGLDIVNTRAVGGAGGT